MQQNYEVTRRVAAGDHRVQPRCVRDAARDRAGRHRRHRGDRAQVQEPQLRFCVAQLLYGAAGRRRRRRRSGPLLRSARSSRAATTAACWCCPTTSPSAPLQNRWASTATRSSRSISVSSRPCGTARKECRRVTNCAFPASAGDPQQLLASLPNDAWNSKQTPDLFHVVQRGETLSSIAPRYGTRVSDLVAINSLSSGARIKTGPEADSAGRRVEEHNGAGRRSGHLSRRRRRRRQNRSWSRRRALAQRHRELRKPMSASRSANQPSSQLANKCSASSCSPKQKFLKLLFRWPASRSQRSSPKNPISSPRSCRPRRRRRMSKS